MKQKTIVDYIARIISTLFVPPVPALFAFVYFTFTIETDPDKMIFSVLISMLLVFIFPIIIFIYLRKKKTISDLDTNLKEQRILPYSLGIVLMFAGIICSFIFQFNNEIILLWLIHFINMVLLVIITRFWKISAHTSGVAIAFGIFSFHLQVVLTLALFVILLLVGWSRMRLKIHSFQQVLLGGILGCTLVYLIELIDSLI
ncbi:MAG: phosphatase PAP2 family protein [Ignavibacteriales bacterium]|nr:MAG: phosphatase PAP2 family protein [Ignavibacteriales bacterium]